jgi:hypothetical protein
MATTTPNFGWAVPTSTDLVKDGAVAIETLGDSIDASLVDLKGGTTGQVLAKASGTDMDFSWVAQDDSNAIQNAIVDAKGDIIAATAADTPARLAVGANNTVLTADSSTATGLKWAAAAGGGKVLQVVQAVSNTSTEVATSTFTDTTLTASITPTSATSKILVMVQQASRVAISSNENYAPLRLLRGATVVFDTRGTTPVGYGGISSGGNGLTTMQLSHFQPMIYLDSPATTSATTYKTQGNSYLTANNGKVTYQWETMASTITLLEIGA